jgi:hypothetical protein
MYTLHLLESFLRNPLGAGRLQRETLNHSVTETGAPADAMGYCGADMAFHKGPEWRHEGRCSCLASSCLACSQPQVEGMALAGTAPLAEKDTAVNGHS